MVSDLCTGLEDAGKPVYKSVAMQCLPSMPFSDNGVDASLVKSILEADSNSTIIYTPPLTSLFVNGSTETGRTAIDPKTVDSNFFTTNYIGAVKDANDTWYAGWTCNSITADFGSTSGSCTTISPT